MQSDIYAKLSKSDKNLVMHKVVAAISDCPTCRQLIQSNSYNRVSNVNKPLVCGPCYPGLLDFPHSCSWLTLSMAYNAFRHKSIDQATYSAWFQLNCGNYYTTDSIFALNIYSERLTTLQTYRRSTEATLNYNATWHGIIYDDHPRCMRVHKCKYHGTALLQFATDYNYKTLTIHNLRSIHTLFPAATKADGKKTNVSLIYLLLELLKDGNIPMINDVLSHFPILTCESIVTFNLINALGNPVAPKMNKLIFEDKACCLDSDTYFKYAKTIGLAARRSARWVDGSALSQEDVTLLSYWEMCTGRSGHKSDWEQEITNRCFTYIPLKPPLHPGPATRDTNAEVVSLLFEEFLNIFRAIAPSDNLSESYADFIMRRQTWCAGGAASGESFVCDGERIRLDKKAFFEQKTHAEMLAWLYSNPIIRAIASEKFEIGKSRAIYGTMTESYTLITYAIQKMEQNINLQDGLESALTGLPELAAIMKRVNVCGKPGTHTTMLDYADFNLQHTLEAQHAMFKAIAQVWRERNAHPDMVTAAMWAAEACLNQEARFPGEKKFRRIVQGMFSGVRSTDFMNTVMNLAYYLVASRYTSEIFNERPIGLYHIHKGDDVWITNKNELWPVVLYSVMQNMGLVFQDSKQLFSQQVGEFLRVRYYNGKMLGYLARAIGAIIERPLQGRDETTAPEILRNLNSELMILYRRGLSRRACSLLWETILHQWSKISKTDNGNTVNIKIPRYLVEQPKDNNGLDLGAPRTMATGGRQVTPVPRMDVMRSTAASVIPMHMTNDYTHYLSQQVRRVMRVSDMKEQIHKVNCVSTATAKDKYRAMRAYTNNLLIWKRRNEATPVYERSERCFDAYMADLPIDRELIRIIHTNLHIIDHKDVVDTPGLMDAIFKAIHSSPFKNIINVQRAFGLNVIDAVYASMQMNPQIQVALNGMTALDTIIHYLDRSIVTEMLKGLSGCGIALECILHPNILSYLHWYAVEVSIRECINKRCKSSSAWKQILTHNIRRAVGSVLHEGSLLCISKY